MSTDKLPESFEAFEEGMLAAEDKRSKRSKPKVASKKKQAEARKTVPLGGMVEGKWSGIRMWTCPRCRATTFKAADAKNHTCKRVKYADEEGLEG